MWVINLYGGPGTGKSTTAAGVFERLKRAGYVAEMAREWCKGIVWDGYTVALQDQVYLTGNVYHELMRFKRGGVEVAVSDSPLLLGTVYGAGEGEAWMTYVRQLNARFKNFDVFLRRVKPFEQKGRVQNESEARELDEEMRLITPMDFTADADRHAPMAICKLWKGAARCGS